MTLSHFIENDIDSLVAEWTGFAESCLPAAKAMDSAALRDGAEGILRAVVDTIARAEAGPPSTLSETARQHAAERLAAGFTLDQLVSEYRALRATVTRHWTSHMAHADRTTLDEFVSFNEAMDESLTGAIHWFQDGLERARHLFIGILGHDLRDPLSAALAATQVQLVTDDVAARRKAAEATNKSLRCMAAMIDNLLDFARTGLGERLLMAPEPVDLGDVCAEVVEAFGFSHRGHDVCLQRSGDLTGTYDPERVRQMLSNLVRNALQHGTPGTAVLLNARGEADELVLTVHNEGTPIPRDKLHVIFDPLRRDDLPTSRSGTSGNLGLGLYIVRQIAEAHRGTVAVESTPEGGTTFAVRLPRAPVVA